ncbi:MAG TPA: alpha/beta hydrolase [Candidatus Dormibacteraeota bacterium]
MNPWARRAAVAAAGLAGAYAAVTTALAVWLVAGIGRRVASGPASIWPDHEELEFPSREPRVRLRGWLFRSGSGVREIFVFVSGFAANRVDAGWGTDDLARRLLQRGYDVLLFDNRSRGESGGRVCTYGHREAADLLGAIDHLESLGYQPGQMTICGGSLGGVIVMLAAPDLPHVGSLVCDSAFADMRMLIDRSRSRHPVAARVVGPGIAAAQRLLFGINHDVRPIDRVAALPDRPFLFIHGTDDAIVPIDHAHLLAEASPNPATRLWIVPGAGHLMAYRDDPDGYLNVLLDFVGRTAAPVAQSV